MNSRLDVCRAAAHLTNNGYSWDRYGPQGWTGAALAIYDAGFTTLEQLKWVMLSKHMRWAGDMDSKRPYGKCNGGTMREYLAKHSAQVEKHLLEEGLLRVRETAPELEPKDRTIWTHGDIVLSLGETAGCYVVTVAGHSRGELSRDNAAAELGGAILHMLGD